MPDPVEQFSSLEAQIKPLGFPVVGVGASAGGLEPILEFVRALPQTPGMAFILIQHLDPHQPSLLSQIVGRETKLPVCEASNELTVEANRIYVIPPDSNISLHHGQLHVTPRSETVGPFMPIDHFFRSLAEDHCNRAAVIILSGGGTDGALGLSEVKASDGITFAQSPKTALHDSMPRSAIRTGAVDFVLSPAEIARELSRVMKDLSHDRISDAEMPHAEADDLRRIFHLVRSATGVDFSQYKYSTVRRRVLRRMALAGTNSLADYIGILEERPVELQALHQDFLIRVTSFFRDPSAFAALTEKVFPALVQDRLPGTPLRIWVAGCSTGEEVYSLAIVLLEFLGDMAGNTPIKILATDISESALEKARAGVYVDNIALDVTPERLRRFFVQTNGSFQICKSVRDLCVFSKHNMAKDNPFANLDLISCRNVLIYFDLALQRRVLPLFHYALKPSGHLILGTAETTSGFSALFEFVDKENRIYSKKLTLSRLPLSFSTGGEASAVISGLPTASSAETSAVEFDIHKETDRMVLSRFCPAGLVIDERLTILQYRGPIGPYLNPISGAATLDALKMVRTGLGLELRAAVTTAAAEDRAIRKDRIRFQEADGVRVVSLEVIPLRTPPRTSRCFFVLFEEVGTTALPVKTESEFSDMSLSDPSRIQLLERELSSARDYLQSLVEQNEAASEELKSAHEEVLSSNEELQSTNEELQTAKEEMQSANEELATVNDELRHRNIELGGLNDDLVNLLGGLDIPIVMVSRDLRIRRFTPPAESVFKLIPTDIGRPISDLHPNLDLPDLEAVISKVIRTLAVHELEVRDTEDKWHLLRIRPYVTSDNKIDGAALAVLDIDQMKRGAERLQAARDYAETIVEAVWQPLIVLDNELRVQRANAAFYRTFRTERDRTEGLHFFELEDGRWNKPKLRAYLEDLRQETTQVRDLEIHVNLPGLGSRSLLVKAQRVEWAAGSTQMVILAIEDVTERKREEEHSQRLASERAARAEAEAANRAKDEFLAMLAHELRNPLAPVRNTLTILRHRCQDDAIAVRALEMSERQVGHMARLLDDLLDVSRITRGKIQLQIEVVDLKQLLGRTAEACRYAMDSRRHALTVKLPTETVFVEGDPARLDQIVSNLLTNAAKYTDPGGRITLEASEHDENVVLSVKDTGVGIAAEMLPRVFELFAQADSSLDRSQGGLGIGLTLVKRLVELHGGTVSASSDGPGMGSEFIVRLPALVRSLPKVKRSRETATNHHVGKRILVIDDNTDAAETMAMALRIFGHEVETAFDGSSGIKNAAEFLPEIIILDIGLPGMDGYEVARRLREHDESRNVMLVAVTGYGTEEDQRKSREAGFDHHLIKPIDIQDLERLLNLPASPI